MASGVKTPNGVLRSPKGILLAEADVAVAPAAAAVTFSAVPGVAYVGTAFTISYATTGVSDPRWTVRRDGQPNGVLTTLPATSGTITYDPQISSSLVFDLYNGTTLVGSSTPVDVHAAGSAPGIVLSAFGGTVAPGTAFTVSGQLANYASQPPLSEALDGAAYAALTGAAAPSFSPSSGAPASFSWTHPGLAAGTHTIQVEDGGGVASNALTVTVAVPAPAPSPGAPGALPSFVYQAVAAQPAGTPVPIGHAFAKGDLSAADARKLTATSGGQTASIQFDQDNSWIADSSRRVGGLSMKLPFAVAAGASVTFQLGVGSTALSTAGFTTAQLAAVSDVKIKVGGGDFGGDSFTVSANDVLANLPRWTGNGSWGTNPLGGWELIRSGPVCTEWRAWRYLKRGSDGASHRWVKCVLYVRAWANAGGAIGGLQVIHKLAQENCYGPHAAGTVGDASTPYAHQGNVSLYNGSTLVKSFTGPSGAAPITRPQRGWWGANSDGSRQWIGIDGSMTAPDFVWQPDQPYLMRATRMVIPYDYDNVNAESGATRNLSANHVESYTPNVSNEGPGIDNTSDDNSDTRYSAISFHGAALLLNGLDPGRLQTVLAYAWSWQDWEISLVDERSGWPVNPGTDDSLSPSPANPGLCMQYGSSKQYGSPPWIGLGPQNATQNWNYNRLMETSHLPAPWIAAYLYTGDAAIEEMGAHTCMAICCSYDQGARNFTYAGVSYQNTVMGYYQNYGAERAGAHFIAHQGHGSRLLRDANPVLPVIQRCLTDNGRCLALATQPYSDPMLSSRWGILWEHPTDANGAAYSGDAFPHLFMTSLMGLHLGHQAWVGEYDGYQQACERMQPAVVGQYKATYPAKVGGMDYTRSAWGNGGDIFPTFAVAPPGVS